MSSFFFQECPDEHDNVKDTGKQAYLRSNYFEQNIQYHEQPKHFFFTSLENADYLHALP